MWRNRLNRRPSVEKFISRVSDNRVSAIYEPIHFGFDVLEPERHPTSIYITTSSQVMWPNRTFRCDISVNFDWISLTTEEWTHSETSIISGLSDNRETIAKLAFPFDLNDAPATWSQLILGVLLNVRHTRYEWIKWICVVNWAVESRAYISTACVVLWAIRGTPSPQKQTHVFIILYLER